MPVVSSSVPPSGRRMRRSSVESGNTIHSRPRALTNAPTAKGTTPSRRHAEIGQSYHPIPIYGGTGLRYSHDFPCTQSAGGPVAVDQESRAKDHQYRLPFGLFGKRNQGVFDTLQSD